jgi:CheY-like chemotaxis protein
MATILVIDDSRFSRNAVKRALAGTGHNLIEAVDGQEGFASVQANQPDYIFTDLLMPVLDGVGFLEQLRGSGSEIPVVVVSADIQESSRVRCEQLGISGFFNKPFKSDELLDYVEKNLFELKSVSS